MFAIRNAVVRAPRLGNLSAVQHRKITCTPPSVRISLTEKIIHGLVIYGGCMAIPMWISANIKNYRAKSK
ncbi:hypothetical protein KM043_004814 [Ampulex compressa]|nr:hypothetical protein KM043_004814 [Ampulex compressa]